MLFQLKALSFRKLDTCSNIFSAEGSELPKAGYVGGSEAVEHAFGRCVENEEGK